MARFSRDNRRLQRLFPSSGTETPVPNEVTDTVFLTHEFPGRPWERLRTAQLVTNTALTPDANVIDLSSPGNFEDNQDGDWVEIIFGDISHDSVTSRAIQIIMQGPNGQNVFLARWDGFISVFTPAQVSGFEPLFVGSGGTQTSIRSPVRPIVVPSGWRLRVLGDTAAAPYTITLVVAFCMHPLPERPLLV